MREMKIKILVLLLLPLPSYAQDPLEGLTESDTITNVQITHYSATPRGGPICRLEGGVGGPDESPSGYRPLSHRIDMAHPGKILGREAILAAVPQSGGTRSIYKCFFTLPDVYPGKLFFAGDFYGPDSNGKKKADISSPCTPIVNKQFRTRLVTYNCGKGRKGGTNPPVKRKEETPAPAKKPEPVEKPNKKPKQETEPERTPPPPKAVGSTCGWYAVFTCDRSMKDAEDERSRIRAPGLSIYNSGGWYCVQSGPAEHDEAAARLRANRNRAPTGYLRKKGC